MRRRFRPTLESLDLRITPSGPSMIYTGPTSHQTIGTLPDDTNVTCYGNGTGSDSDGGNDDFNNAGNGGFTLYHN